VSIAGRSDQILLLCGARGSGGFVPSVTGDVTVEVGSQGICIDAVAHADPAGEARANRASSAELDDRAAGQPLTGVPGADRCGGYRGERDPKRLLGQQSVEVEGTGFEPVMVVSACVETVLAVAFPPFPVDLRTRY
jgi:hypothetical protein